MNNIISFVNGDPAVSSSIIADHTQNQHKNVIELIHRYYSDFEEFGGVAFETEPFNTAGGVQRRKICRLNEDQAALLMTYLRNNQIVRSFKKQLIKAFKEAKQVPALPNFNNPVEAARAWADAKESEIKALADLEAAILGSFCFLFTSVLRVAVFPITYHIALFSMGAHPPTEVTNLCGTSLILRRFQTRQHWIAHQCLLCFIQQLQFFSIILIAEQLSNDGFVIG